MKILVTGQNSYAGAQFAKRMLDVNKEWKIDFISLRDVEWKKKSFSDYDAIYHVAGIVHKKETAANKEVYYEVNRDLTNQLAIKAKNEGVKSFVFLSTMAVYGTIGKIGEDLIISKKTKVAPKSHYGKSKLEAEESIEAIQSAEFKCSILRVPMIYGPGCPGNYSLLSKLAKKTPVFPKINNRRSMIFVDHLSDIVAFIIKERKEGVFLVKNPKDVSTLKIVKEISENHNKAIYFSFIMGSLIKRFGNLFSVTKKLFGNVYFEDRDCKIDGFNYDLINFNESIRRSEL